MVSFIIPAHNEQAFLPDTLTALHRAAHGSGVGDYEILVANDASTDATAEVAAEHGARVLDVNARQIAAVRNAGARAAVGDHLFFIDADTRVHADLLRAALNVLEHGAVGGGARVEFDDPDARRWQIASVAWNIASRGARWAAGCFLFARRQAFEQVGGFNETLFAAEEIDLSIRLQRLGPFAILPQPVLTSARKGDAALIGTHLALLARMLTCGPRVLKTRDGLELWYEPQREPQQS